MRHVLFLPHTIIKLWSWLRWPISKPVFHFENQDVNINSDNRHTKKTSMLPQAELSAKSQFTGTSLPMWNFCSAPKSKVSSGEKVLMSHLTHNRSFRGRLLQELKDFSRTFKYIFKTYFSDVSLRFGQWHIKSNQMKLVLLTVVTKTADNVMQQ